MIRAVLRGWPGMAVLALTAAGLVAQEKAADWPRFRGADGAGVSGDRGVPAKWSAKENVLWKSEVSGPGTSSPVIIGGKMFLTSFSGFNVPGMRGDMESLKRHVVRLDPKTGKTVWSKEVPTKLPEQDRIREGHGYATNTPAVDEERVYVFFGKSGVFAFDHDGKQLWQADVGSKLSGWGSATSPVLYKDLVIVNASVESESVVALDRKTGKEQWRAEGIKESWATPVLVRPAGGDADELVVPVFGKVLGLDPTTGKQLWSCATDIPWYMAPSPIAHGGVVYCLGGRPGGALAIKAGGRGDVTETHRLWKIDKGSNVSSPVYHEGRLYWAHDNSGMVYCADAKTGEIVYEKRLPRASGNYAAGLLAGGRLYYVDRAGRTFVVAAKPEFELLGVNDLSDRTQFNSTPVPWGGRLYIRSEKALYCLGKE